MYCLIVVKDLDLLVVLGSESEGAPAGRLAQVIVPGASDDEMDVLCSRKLERLLLVVGARRADGVVYMSPEPTGGGWRGERVAAFVCEKGVHRGGCGRVVSRR